MEENNIQPVLEEAPSVKSLKTFAGLLKPVNINKRINIKQLTRRDKK